MFEIGPAKLDGSPPRTNYMKREELLQLYREEKDPSVKDRLMLIIKAKFDDASITKAAGSLGRVTSWGSKWFNRFARDGVEGLRNLPKCGRPPLITEEESERIQNELDGKNYWTVGKARELISKGTGVTYSISSVYRLLKHWQYRLRTPVKRHVRRHQTRRLPSSRRNWQSSYRRRSRGATQWPCRTRQSRPQTPGPEGSTPRRERGPSAPLPARMGRR